MMGKMMFVLMVYWPLIAGTLLALLAWYVNCPRTGVGATFAVGTMLQILWYWFISGLHFQ